MPDKNIQLGKLLSGQSMFSPRAVAAVLVLAAAGALGNYFTLWLFPGVEILFGSIAVLIAARTLGLFWALVVGTVSVIPLVAVWHHPFGPILYGGEAVVLSFACQFSRRNIVTLDAIYWLLIGMPATWLLNYWVGSGDSSMATYYALRNGVNGIVDALIALLIIQLPTMLGWSSQKGQKISLRQAVFTLLFTSALVPILVLTASNIRQQQGMIEANISRDLGFFSEELLRELPGYPDPAEMARELQAHDYHGQMILTVLDKAGRIFAASRGDLVPGQVYAHEGNIRLDPEFTQDGKRQSPRIITASAIYRDGFYFERAMALPGNGDLTLLVEIPAEPYQKEMRQIYIDSIRTVLGLIALGFVLGRLVSYNLTDTLAKLAEASTNLRWKVLEGESAHLPVSPIIEINTLVANFGDMAIGLGKSFRELSNSHEALEQGINERTHELHEINRQLELEIAERKQFEEQLAERALALEKTMGELETQKFAMDQHSIVAIADPAGKIVYANDRFCEISQYSCEELLGQNHRILNSGYHPKSFFVEMWATITRGKVWRGEIRNRKKDGSFYWVESTIVPFLDHSGKPYQYVSIRTDITARRRSEDALVKLNRTLKMLNSCDEALVRISDENELLYEICRICVETGGYRMAWVGFAMEDAAKSVRPIAVAGAEMSYLEKTRVVWDVGSEFGRGPAGVAIRSGLYCLSQNIASDPIMMPWREEALARGYTSVIALPLDGEPASVLVVLSATVGGFEKDEVDLLRDLAGNLAYGLKSLRLAAENKRAGQELLRAKDEAEQANRAKSEFLSRMSHELRTPLNAILGFAQLMENDPVEPLSPSQSESVKHIIQAGWHQLALVNEVLDLARIEAGRMQLNLERVMLAQEVHECIDLVSPLSSERQIKVEDYVSTCGECFVWADPTRFKQVMLNLLSNAIKYNREGGTITLACRCLAPGRHRVSITDTGHGIPADKLDQLFVPFNRLDADKSHIQGTGVGLAVAKRLVELMGGKIGVESRLGEGTTFWLDLPEHGSDDVVTGGASIAADSGHVLLYIEDNSANQALVSSLLKSRRPDVTLLSALTAEWGLELLHTTRTDLILMDMSLPGMSGLEALCMLREDDQLCSIPVIAVSADATPRNIELALEAGFSGFVTKPIEIDKLLAAIDEVLKTVPSEKQS